MSVADAVAAFLGDLTQARRSPATVAAYRSDLTALAAAVPTRLADVTAADLRAHFGTLGHLAASTRARRQASAASFFRWAYQQELIKSDPMGRVARVRCEPPLPRGMTPVQVDALLAAVPAERLRDRVLLRLLASTGLRIGEALALHVEDLDLTRDDERIRVTGKGGRRRTILLDDPELLRLLRRYLRDTGVKRGPLFRAGRSASSSPLRYQSFHEHFTRYARAAGLEGVSLHDLRHAHAQQLVNGGVSLTTIRKRLGHASITTTTRYADQADAVADGELRSWRRSQSH